MRLPTTAGLRATGLVAVALVLAGCGSSNGSGSAPTTPTTAAPAPSSTAAPTTVAPTSTSPATTTTNVIPPVTAGVHVWFLNDNHVATGELPLFEPVDRQVRPPAIAAGALDALFAGPTTAEQAAGLRLVTSGATGYSRLHIEDGIAYVTLEGTCATNGSTITIAGEIMPTLKQFASVRYVKIFAPEGTTETPTGAVDSIPLCLEP